MLRQTYYEFIDRFGELNPYELAHLSESMYRRLLQIIEQRNAAIEKPLFTEHDLKHAFIKTMIEVRVSLAELRKKEAEQQLKLAKAAATAARLPDTPS